MSLRFVSEDINNGNDCIVVIKKFYYFRNEQSLSPEINRIHKFTFQKNNLIALSGK